MQEVKRPKKPLSNNIEMCGFLRFGFVEKCAGALCYHEKKAYVLSNTREITTNGKITYIPIYNVMFLGAENNITL